MSIPKDLLDAVGKRQCVLFLGAGVHYPPPEDSEYKYPEAQRPPLGATFSQQLADECIAELDEQSRDDVPDPNASEDERWRQRQNEKEREQKRQYLRKHRDVLQRTAWYYQVIQHTRSALVDKIKSAVDDGKQPSPVLRGLAALDFPVVITTNYDRLFEKALMAAGKTPMVRIYNPKGMEATKEFLGDPSVAEPWFFKMHGCISERESIVMTDEDYIHFVMRMGDSVAFHPVPIKLQTKFKEWPTLFVGYSLLDYNLRLLFRTLRRYVDLAEWPATFSLDPWPDLLVLATYGARIGAGSPVPMVSFIEQDSWRFVPELYQKLLNKRMPQ